MADPTNHKPLQPADMAQAVQKKAAAHPLASSSVQAGFPSPADNHIENQLDLNELLIQHPAATFYVRVEGDSMLNAGIHSGDILVVDRSLNPSNGKIVIAILNGEFTVKRFLLKKNRVVLAAENPAYSDIPISENSDFQVWGVVTFVIHKF